MIARLSLLVLLGATACAETDPYLRQGEWQPEGANAGNLAAMVVDKHDLIRGHGAANAGHRMAIDAVTHLWENPISVAFGTTSSASATPPPAASPPGTPPLTPAAN